MSKQKRKKTSMSQKLFWAMSVFIAVLMVLSFLVTSLPSPPQPTVTPRPTDTRTLPTIPPATPTEEPSPSPIAPVGPVLPTSTPTLTPTLTATPLAQAPVMPATRMSETVASVSGTTATEFRFAVTGDSRDNPSQYRKLLDAVAAGGSEFLINVGDLVNIGTGAQWRVFVESMAGFGLPFYPVPGNHDALLGNLDGYLKHSGAPAAHYSFDRGLAHLAFADSHHGGVSASELDWLHQDLQGSSQPVKMVFLHHPPFDPDGTDHIMAFGNEAFMQLMVQERVDYVFAGHIHAYSRAERDGTVYVITGGGGARLYTEGHPQAFHHYLRVAVQGQQVTIEVVKV